MKRRTFVVGFGTAAVTWPSAARAQQQHRRYRIGFLGDGQSSVLAEWIDSLRAGLRELNYIEGVNFELVFRWTEGRSESLPRAAAELVASNVDVIVTWGTPGTRAAKEATARIPIVMSMTGDAVATGLISSLARPGVNVTGMTQFNPELCAKRLELLKEAFPHMSRVGVLLNPLNPITAKNLDAAEKTAKAWKMELETFDVTKTGDIDQALARMSTDGIEAIAIFEDPLIMASGDSIVTRAAALRLPVVGYLELAPVGALIAYGVSFPDAFRRSATFVDKILKGARPEDIPVERPSRFKLILNSIAAKSFNFTFPTTMLFRADEVIE
jgi:putative ABC transport system substrate-binding protein